MGDDTILSTALKAIAHEDRRAVLDTLADDNEVAVTVTDDTTKMALLHNHLPKLADGGYIEYEHKRGSLVVRRGPDWPILEGLYEKIQKADLG